MGDYIVRAGLFDISLARENYMKALSHLSHEGLESEEKRSHIYKKLFRFENVSSTVKRNFEKLGMPGAKIYPQPKKIVKESLEFVDGEIHYDQIEVEPDGQVIKGLNKENQTLFGFPEGSIDYIWNQI